STPPCFRAVDRGPVASAAHRSRAVGDRRARGAGRAIAAAFATRPLAALELRSFGSRDAVVLDADLARLARLGPTADDVTLGRLISARLGAPGGRGHPREARAAAAPPLTGSVHAPACRVRRMLHRQQLARGDDIGR